MKSKFILGITFAFAMVSITACQSAVPSLVQSSAGDTSKRTIIVAGDGFVTAKPDLARLNLGVETFATTLADAMKQNSARVTTMIAKLKSLAIADKDIQTTNLSINVERNFDRGAQGTVTGYRVSNTVVIVIRDLNKVSDIIDQATQAGANNVYGINFGIENTTKLESEARAKAVADAQARADDIAKLHGLERGQVITMSEGASTMPVTLESSSLLKAQGGGGGPPVEVGTLEIRVHVQITFAVK